MPVPPGAMTLHPMGWSHRAPLTPPELLLGKCAGIHWKVSLNFSFADYLLHFTEGCYRYIKVCQKINKCLSVELPKTCNSVWLDTNNPTFLRALLQCWERTKPSVIKSPQKAKAHFFAALYHTSVFRHQPFFLIYQELPGVSATQQLLAPGQFFFLPSRPQSAASLDCNFVL